MGSSFQNSVVLSLATVCVIFLATAVSSEVAPSRDTIRAGTLDEVLARGKTKRHIAVLSIPLYGHFMPCKAVAEQLAGLGHKVTLFVEDPSWCVTTIPAGLRCAVLPRTNIFTKAFWHNCSEAVDFGASMMMLFDALAEHHRIALGDFLKVFEAETTNTENGEIDLLLIDLSTYAGFSVAAKFGVPYVTMFPLTLQMTVGPETWVPALGTAFPAAMGFGQRFINWVIRAFMPLAGDALLRPLNDVRQRHGVPLLMDLTELAGLHSLMLAPTIWGYDIAQPVCPNVLPLGVISPTHDHTPIEPQLADFLSSDICRAGSIYVNFGTLAFLNDRIFESVLDALRQASARAHLCVVWKVPEATRRREIDISLQQSQVPSHSADDGSSLQQRRFFVTSRFNNPVAIMMHPRTIMFLSHCGDTSVGEAISAALPIVGLPFFADQGDVCQRVSESGIGVSLTDKRSFSTQQLVEALLLVGQNRTTTGDEAAEGNIGTPNDLQPQKAQNRFLRNVHRLRSLADLNGGATRGAQVIDELLEGGLLANYSDIFPFACDYVRGTPLWKLQSLDVSAVAIACWMVVLFAGWRCVVSPRGFKKG